MSTEKLNVLVLATGATINLDGATVKVENVVHTPQFELEQDSLELDEDTNLGFDPMNSADKLKPQARRVHCDRARQVLAVSRERRKKIPVQNGGLTEASLDWLEGFFSTGVPHYA